MQRIAFVAFTTLIGAALNGEEIRKRYNGLPLYQIFEDKDIANSSRGHFLSSSPNNMLYYCSESGVHTFDGSTWKLILSTPATRDKIRSLQWIDDTIYAGGYSSVGRLNFDPVDGVSYVPLNDNPLTPDASEAYNEIYRIGEWICFVGARSVILYHPKTGELLPHSFNTWIKASHEINGELYISADRGGVWKLVGREFVNVPGYENFSEHRFIASTTANPAGEIAFATANRELFRIVNGHPEPAFPAFAARQKADIMDIAFLDNERLAVAVAGQGVMVIDSEGRTLASITKEFDYRWAAVHALHVDRAGALWTLFRSHVGKALTDSPVTTIDERLRPPLDWPQVYPHEGELYLRNNGRLYRAAHTDDGQLTGFVNDLSDPSLSVSIAHLAGNSLYLYANGSLYRKDGDQLIHLGNHGRIDRLATFRSDPNLLLGVSASRLKLLRLEGDAAILETETRHTAGLVNKIARDADNVFWLETGLGSVARVWLQNGELQFKHYTSEHGLPVDWVAIWEHEGRVRFTERTGVFRFLPETDRFESSDELEPYFPRANGSLHRVVTDPSGNIWASYQNGSYILWRKPDGSYLKDGISLSQLGEIYINEFSFQPDGNAILLTEAEMYHVETGRIRPPDTIALMPTFIAELMKIDGKQAYYLNNGIETNLPYIRFAPGTNSLSIRIANTFSATLTEPTYQYFLDGLSSDWSKWSQANEMAFTNLAYGNHRLRIRTRVGEMADLPELSLSFRLVPSFYQTPYAYLLYTLIGLLALLSGYRFFARNLKTANERLERMVTERTSEIERKNAELKSQAHALELKNTELAEQSLQLQTNTNELTFALHELRSAQDQLMSASRKAGMAEVAINVLHNVGNVLNSINITALGLADHLDHARIEKLARVADMLAARRDDLPEFLLRDPKGQAIPEYLARLAKVLKEDFARCQIEVETMRDNIDHVKEIIATQQAHAKTVDVFQEIALPELIDMAITMIMGEAEHSSYKISRDYDPDLRIESDKHRILQMVANFIKNAKEAIAEAEPPSGLIQVAARYDDDGENAVLTIADNGVGIAPANLGKIFIHGFTTKSEGHGFGMHSCANSAKALGGRLRIDSDGLAKGATVTLTLPVKPPRSDPKNATLKMASA